MSFSKSILTIKWKSYYSEGPGEVMCLPIRSLESFPGSPAVPQLCSLPSPSLLCCLLWFRSWSQALTSLLLQSWTFTREELGMVEEIMGRGKQNGSVRFGHVPDISVLGFRILFIYMCFLNLLTTCPSHNHLRMISSDRVGSLCKHSKTGRI